MSNIIKWLFIIFVFFVACVLYVNLKTSSGPIEWATEIGKAVTSVIEFIVYLFNKIF